MPYIANTPETAAARTDSLDPETTCRGVTSNGKPCRRPLNPPPSSSPSKGRGTDPAEFYCWQHKDQAQQSAASAAGKGGGGGKSGKLQKKTERSSIDTLIDRLGILNLEDDGEGKKKKKNGRKNNAHQTSSSPSSPSPSNTTAEPKPKKSKMRLLCSCFPFADHDEEDQLPASRPVEKPPAETPSPHDSTSSQTQSLLKWIPPTLPPQTASALLNELAKPISEADEDGFIYMFWVTPADAASPKGGAPPPGEIASALLPSPNGKSRRASDAQNQNQTQTQNQYFTGSNPGTIRLKIGRTSNVQRRLNEWTRQCSHNLTLIRYYPYTPNSVSSPPGNGSQAKKVPHVHRVERLIHIELGDKRVKGLGPCKDCGKEHREWFEVAAKKEELRKVDECIRRWVDWAEKHK